MERVKVTVYIYLLIYFGPTRHERKIGICNEVLSAKQRVLGCFENENTKTEQEGYPTQEWLIVDEKPEPASYTEKRPAR